MKFLALVFSVVCCLVTVGTEISRADDKKPDPSKTDSAPSKTGQIKAKVLYDGNDLDGASGGDGKVSNERSPNTNGSDLPYPEEDLKQTDPSGVSPNKNMPVDQD